MNYNIEQLNFIKESISDMKLLGIPGGGKTQSIIGKIVHHFNNNDFNNIYNFMLLTFSRRATNDFINKGKSTKFISKNNVKTIHSLSGKIVYALNKSKSSIKEIIILNALNIIEDDNRREELLGLEYLQNLKVIFVDEAQDLSTLQYDFICALKKLTNCSVVLIGDPNQNIYQFQNGSDKHLLNHDGKTFYLTTNYRSTQPIVNIINELRPWSGTLPLMKSYHETADLSKPVLKPVVFVGTINEIIENIVIEIKKSIYKPCDIAIIGPVKKSKPIDYYYTNIGLSLFTNILNQYDIKYIKHYEDNNFNSESEFKELKKKDDHVNLFTIHGSKGLEFKQVFLVNFHFKTFGIIPTVEKYNEFKYLWYVGVSRCCYNLRIYIDSNKSCWHEFRGVNSDLYRIENGNIKFERELYFNEKIKPIEYCITEIINSKEYFDEYIYEEFTNLLKYNVKKSSLYTIEFNKEDTEILAEYNEYSKLTGKFIENIFNYYYHYKNRVLPDFIIKLENKLLKTIIIPLKEKRIVQGYKTLKIKRSHLLSSSINLDNLNSIKNTFNKYEYELFDYLLTIMDNDYKSHFYLDIENEVFKYMKERLLKVIKEVKKSNTDYHYYDNKLINNLFMITLYEYQKEYECAFLIDHDFTDLLKGLRQHITKIKQFIFNNNNKYNFHGISIHPCINLIGEYDIMQDNKIIELKFTKEINIKYIMQVFLYYNNIFPDWKCKPELEIWNLYRGEIYKIEFNLEEMNAFSIMRVICKAIKVKMKFCQFVYDLDVYSYEKGGIIDKNNYYREIKESNIINWHFQEYKLDFIGTTGNIKKQETMNYKDNYSRFMHEIRDIINYCEKPLLISYQINNKILIEEKIVSYHEVEFLDIKNLLEIKKGSVEDLCYKRYKIQLNKLLLKQSVKVLIDMIKEIDSKLIKYVGCS